MTGGKRELRSDRVHESLLGQILRGELEPGASVPSERILSEELGVNRHAVREAMKRLQQARLVETSQGGATRVADWRRTAGLDLLIELAGEADPVLVRSVVEARRTIGVDAARALSERSGRGELPADDLARIEALAADPPGAGEDRQARRERYIGMWDAIIEGSGSLVYRLAYNSLIWGSAQLIEEMGDVFSPEETDSVAQTTLLDACSRGDREDATAAALALLDRAVVALGGEPLAQSASASSSS